jgi:translocation and assembly module TamB
VGLLLLIGAVLLALQTDSGATTAAQWLAGAANPLPNTELTIQGASGSWIRSLELTGVKLTRSQVETGEPVTMARVDTLAARYHLWPLVQGRLHVSRVSVAGPDITMRQAADSTWDWTRVLPDSEPSTADTSAAMPIRIDAVRVVRGSAAAAFYAEGRDSTARLRTLQVRAHDLRSASALSGRLDTLSLRGRLPGDTTDLRLAARGALSDTTATLDTLRFDSPRSRVRGHGRADLPSGPADTVDNVSVQLRADPLALRDLTLVAPTLDVDPQETVRFDLQMDGSSRRLTASADVQFSGGGDVTIQAAGTPTTTAPEGSPLHYRLDAEVRRLTTSLLGPPDSTRNRLNATLSANVEGPSLTALDGTVDAQVTNTRSAGLRTPEITFASTLDDGTASLDLQGLLNGARLQASGQARPLDDAPSATVTTTIQGLNLAKFAPDAGVESDLTTTTDLRARALGTDRQTVDATMTLDSSRVGVQRIVDGQLEGTLRPERAEFGGRLTLPAGSVEAAGFAALDGTERFALETARLEGVNAAALAGDTTASRLTGTAQVEGRGFSPETMRLDAELTLRDSFYGPHRLPSLSTTVTLAEGRLTSTTDATLNGGTWALAVEGTPFTKTPTVEFTRGRFRNLDVGPFLADTTQPSELHGTIRGTVRGTDPTTMTVDAGLTLDSSRVNQQRIDEAALDLRLRDGRLSTDFALDTPGGGVQLAATARPFDAVPTYRVTEGSFAALDVGALADQPGLSTALSGTLSLTGRGATASTLALDADLSFANSQINDATLSQGRLRATTDAGRATLDGQLAVGGGTVDVSGSVDSIDTTPAYTLQTTVDSLDTAALAGRDSLNARLDSLRWTLEGRGTDPSTLRASTTVFVRDMQADQFTLDTLAVAGTLRQGRLALDTVRAASNVFASAGGGTLALTDTAAASSFTLRTEVTNTEPVRRLAGAEAFQLQRGVVETTISGSSLATQQLDGTIKIERLLYNDLRLPQAEFAISGRRGREQVLGQVELDGTLRSLSLPSLSTDRIALQAAYDGTTADLSTRVELPSPYSASLAAAVTPGADQTDVTLTRLDLQLQDDPWSLSNDATLSVGDRYRVRDLQLQSGDQRIAVDGVVSMSGEQDAGVTIEDVRLGPVAPLAGLEGVDGTLNGTLDLSGSATAPQLDSRLTLDLRSEDQAVGTLELDTAYEGLALDINARMAHTDGSVLTATGTLPADLRLQAPDAVDVAGRSVRLELEADPFPLDWVDPFLDPATAQNVEGSLAADVTVGGTLDAPTLEGTAALSDGAARLPDLGTRYHGGTASLRFAENQIVLEEAVVRSDNDGQFRVDGTISVPKLTVGAFDLTLSASDFIAIDTRAVRRALVNGTMTMQGSVQQPVLAGSLKMNNAEIFYNELLAGSGGATAITLTEEDRLTLKNRFGIQLAPADTTTSDVYEALEMDLSVRIQRDTWLRSRSSPEMDLQFEGDLDLNKAQSDDLQVFGDIQVVTRRSTLRQFGQEFQITEGTLTFNGDPAAPRVALEAVYEQRARGSQKSEVSITLNLKGRPDDLTPTLTSDPPMETRNILSYLATGRPADELGSGGGGGGSGNMATQMALGKAADAVEDIAAKELGLDVVRVQIRPSGLSYLTVGRYLTPRLFASIQQPVTNAASTTQQTSQYLPDLALEYQLTDTFMLRVLNNQQSLQFNFLFEYAY